MPYLTVIVPASGGETGLTGDRHYGDVRCNADEKADHGYGTLLQNSVAATQAALDELGVDHQLLVVDDATSVEVSVGDDRHVHVIRHPQRYGLWQALYLGLLSARSELVMYMPVGLTPEAGELRRCVRMADEAQVVAVTCVQRAIPLSRRAMALAARALFGLPLNPFPDLCIFRTAAMQEIWIEYADSEFIKAELLIKAHDMGYLLAETQMYCSMPPPHTPGASVRCWYDLLHFWAHRLLKKRRDGRRDWRVGVPEHG